MKIKYGFDFEEVSVYANVVKLITQRAQPGSLHIDLGCGNAAIAGVLQQLGIDYLGFDGNAESVARINARGIEAYTIDLNQPTQAIEAIFSRVENRKVASISMIDVIEHLDDAHLLLDLLALESQKRDPFLLVTSVPNFAHADVSTKLISGSWDYTETGLLDRTHRVIYTESNLIQLALSAGWSQIAAQDYRLEITEQRALPASNPSRASGGTDFLLRQLKRRIDPLYNVYQFVRSFEASAVLNKPKCGPPVASIAVTNPQDLNTLVLLLEQSTWLSKLTAPLELILSASLSAHDVPIQTPMLFVRQLGLHEPIERVISGRYLLHFSRHSQWYPEAFGQAIDALLDGTMEGIVHAGPGRPHLDSAFADWLEVARTLSANTIRRSFYPVNYITHYQDPIPQESDLNSCAQHFFRVAARVGVRHLNLLSSNTTDDAPLTDAANNLGLIDSLSAYHLLILDGKIPDGVIKLRDDLHISHISVLDKTQQLDAANSIILDITEQLVTANSIIIDKTEQLATANNVIQKMSSQLEQRDKQINAQQVHLSESSNQLVQTRLRLEWLEKELVDTRQTLSWRLTRPLRAITSARQRLLNPGTNQHTHHTWMQRIKTKLFNVVISAAHRTQNWTVARSSSPHNLLAVQALSARRFDLSNASPADPIHSMDLPCIDVSVVSFNSAKWIDNFMASLISQHYPVEKIHLVVVDHGSTDSTLNQLKEWKTRNGATFARFEIIEQPNLGFGAGHHRAISTGHSDYCLVTNLDLEFPAASIVTVVKAALSDKTSQVASWELRQIPYEHPKYYDPVTLETNWSSHACILMLRSAYEAVGGYDDRIFMYAEDVEMSYRFRSHGYALKYVPQALVRHFSYEQAGEVKPLQFLGSILGNNYIRMRYGRTKDLIIGFLMYGLRFVFAAPFPGARRALLRNSPKLLLNSSHFLKGKGSCQAYFPLRGYDYEMIRDGAFWSITELPVSEHLPKISIIMRTYQGRGALLAQAIQSVFNQTYPHIELLVVEDGGDTQQALVQSLSDTSPVHVNIRFLANPKLGRSAAGNSALAQATGQFMLFLDDDDLLFADHLETLVQPLFNDETLAACYSLAFEVATDMSDDKTSYTELNFQTHQILRQEWDYQVLCHHNFIPIQAILFRRSLYEEHGGFDTDLDQLEDWNLWLRYGYQQRFQYIPKTTSYYRTPAQAKVRHERHQLLHEAYDLAKTRALQALESKSH